MTCYKGNNDFFPSTLDVHRRKIRQREILGSPLCALSLRFCYPNISSADIRFLLKEQCHEDFAVLSQ